MKVCLATPIHHHPTRQYMMSLLAAWNKKLFHDLLFTESESLVPRARNVIAWQFLHQTESEAVLMVDSDIVFELDHVRELVKALERPCVDVIGGCYRKRVEGGTWVFNPKDGDIREPVGSVPYRVSEIGTGFLLIRRGVFEELNRLVDNYTGEHGRDMKDYFACGPRYRRFPWVTEESVRWDHYDSEDYGFCELCRKAGIGIYLHPLVRLGHVGEKVFR